MTAATEGKPGTSSPGHDRSITQEEIEELLDQEQSNGEVGLDETFDILRNQRRRDVLLYLVDTEDGTATLGDLAEHVAAKENEIEPDQLSSKQRKRVYIGLYQCHLPKLDESGVVEYDQDRGTVVLDSDSQVFSYLGEVTESPESSRWSLYGAVAVSGLVLTGLLGPGALAAVPTAAWALLSTVALVGVALYHTVLR